MYFILLLIEYFILIFKKNELKFLVKMNLYE